MTLQRLIITFKLEGVEIRTLYRSKNGPNPGRKSRAREVRELARTGLREAMEALEGYVDVIGTSGYQVREDTISVDVRCREEGSVVDVARADTVDAELDRLISKRASQDRRLDPDEQEELWKESVRAYTARRREEMRAAWQGTTRDRPHATGPSWSPW